MLGQFHDGSRTLTTVLFPADVTQILKAFANLGLVIFMFIIGLELDLKLIKGNERKAGVISLSSILVPFVGGALLALLSTTTIRRAAWPTVSTSRSWRSPCSSAPRCA